MTRETVVVDIPKNLESRPVAMLVQVASRYDSKIYLECGNKRVNAKSIMGMMTLGLNAGDQITIEADGSDETDAAEELAKFLVR